MYSYTKLQQSPLAAVLYLVGKYPPFLRVTPEPSFFSGAEDIMACRRHRHVWTR